MNSIQEMQTLRVKAENGDPVAQNQLGDLLYHGTTVRQDYAEALKWYTSAAVQGHSQAIVSTGMMYYVNSDCKMAEKWWLQGAGQGDPEAQTCLAGLYFYDDENGVGLMPDLGLAWYRKAIDQGHSPAMYNLAMMYQENVGVDQDIPEAERLFFMAAERGDELSQRQLVNLFFTQNDFEHDNSVRSAFIARLESDRYVAAQYAMGSYYCYGLGVEQDYKKCIDWWSKATAQGDSLAPFMIGMIFYRGIIKPKCLEIARYWFQKSCENGNPKGCRALDGLMANNRIPADIFAEYVEHDDFMFNGDKFPF
ncbi:MAG: sel1 repeat family protein [Desulfobulbaceae bacterium]|nr:sel1 repeat family protein [Desulfobulbaceae bacterium]